MEIIGIVGSPREGGNTDLLVEAILDGVRSKDKTAVTEKIMLNQLNISPCQACFEPNSEIENRKCNVSDDMDDLYTKLEYADGIIWGTPIYYGGVTAQMKAFIDRFYCKFGWDFRHRLSTGKCGIIVVTWGDPRGAILEINYFVTDILKSLMEQLGIEVINELTVRGIAEKGKIKEHEDILETAFNQGAELVEILQMPYIPRLKAELKTHEKDEAKKQKFIEEGENEETEDDPMEEMSYALADAQEEIIDEEDDYKDSK